MAGLPILVALLAAMFAPGAADGATPTGWIRQTPVTIPSVGSYSIAVPGEVNGGPEQGVDSLVAGYRGPEFRLSFDFGMYGARPDCGHRRCSSIEIDGLPATLARAVPGSEPSDPEGTHWLHLYVALPGPGGMGVINLVAYANCETETACIAALRVLETIDFSLKPETGSAL